jgi:hypothetical protein
VSEATEYDPTDEGTLRPDEDPIQEQGDHFKPMEIEVRAACIHLPVAIQYYNAYALFRQYFTKAIVESIVEYTNTCSRKAYQDPCSQSKMEGWFDTTVDEIFVFYAIRIYMTLHIENKLKDYWKTKENTPFHPITKHISRDRYLVLHVRLRICPPGTDGAYLKVSYSLYMT